MEHENVIDVRLVVADVIVQFDSPWVDFLSSSY